MSRYQVAVIFGGKSSEHEVSLVSASSVLRNIPKEKYDIIMLGITRDGAWLRYSGPIEDIADGAWEGHPDNQAVAFSTDGKFRGLFIFNGDQIADRIALDAVFPVLHGKNGEDGTIQGMLQLTGIPFVGCGCAASAVTMDKIYTNMVLDCAKIPQAMWTWCLARDFDQTPEHILDRVIDQLGFPIFVKPANAGSSVGVGKAKNRAELADCIRRACVCDSRILFEEGIDGVEVECAVLGNDEPIASTVGEIVPYNEFYDYDAKYNTPSGLYIPARIPAETMELVRARARQAFKALGCEGLARVDFFVRRSDGAVLLNEPNTIPGFTSISMYPKLFEASGIPYPQLLDQLFELSIERGCR